jgi:preprotein translocase YajC subunit
MTSALCGQEAALPGPVAPSIGGVEAGEAGQGIAVPTATDTEGLVASSSPSLLPKAKKSLTFTEELISNPINYILLMVVCVYIYLVFLQPKAGRTAQRELVEKLKNLKKNDRVVTTSGIHGIVANINSEADTITLRVDENSNAKLTIDRMSIRSIVS